MGGFQSFRCGRNKKSRDGSGVNNCYDWAGDSSLEEGGRTPLYTLLSSFLSFPNLCSFFSQITGKLQILKIKKMKETQQILNVL